MSTPIYDDLCETMPAPSGIDEDDAVPGQGNEGNGAAGHIGQANADHDGHGDGIATRNGRTERKATADTTAE